MTIQYDPDIVVEVTVTQKASDSDADSHPESSSYVVFVESKPTTGSDVWRPR